MEKTMFEHVKKIATEVMLKQGRHAPQAMLVTDKGLQIIILKFDGDAEKEKSKDLLRTLVQKTQAKQYFIINEAWIKKISYGDEPVNRPSLYKDKEECLLISEYKKNITGKTCMKFFKHIEKDKIEFTEEITNENTDFMSTWNFYLEKEGVIERMDKQSQITNDAFLKKVSEKLSKKYFKRIAKAETESERRSILKEMVQEIKSIKKKQDSKLVK